MWQCSIGNFFEHFEGFSEHGIFHGITNWQENKPLNIKEKKIENLNQKNYGQRLTLKSLIIAEIVLVIFVITVFSLYYRRRGKHQLLKESLNEIEKNTNALKKDLNQLKNFDN